jgi:hypothetical protein
MAASQGIFLTSQHETSGRSAIFEDNGTSAWFYMTEAGNRTPEHDAFVYSPIPPVSKESAIAEAKAGNPPPLATEYAAANQPFTGATASNISFVWSADGEAVSLHYEGIPIAMITAESRQGFSKAVAKPGPYGLPWSQSVYRTRFAR